MGLGNGRYLLAVFALISCKIALSDLYISVKITLSDSIESLLVWVGVFTVRKPDGVEGFCWRM